MEVCQICRCRPVTFSHAQIGHFCALHEPHRVSSRRNATALIGVHYKLNAAEKLFDVADSDEWFAEVIGALRDLTRIMEEKS